MGWKSTALSMVDLPLRLLGASLVPHREHRQMQLLRENISEPMEFRVGGRSFRQFAHGYNCGWPFLASATERSVELAIADHWLYQADLDRVTEIGAVTPYYWPCRVRDIVDPTDPHPQVNRRVSLFDVDLTGRSVLSISTFEHVGTGDYGLGADLPAAGRALDKLYEESPNFVITFASGYNKWLDSQLLNRSAQPRDVDVRLIVRDDSGVGWAERPLERANVRAYGSAGGNSLFLMSRGSLLHAPVA